MKRRQIDKVMSLENELRAVEYNIKLLNRVKDDFVIEFQLDSAAGSSFRTVLSEGKDLAAFVAIKAALLAREAAIATDLTAQLAALGVDVT